MKKILLFTFVLLTSRLIIAQKNNIPRHVIVLSEENDGINAWFRGTDWGYTNGTGISYFGPGKKSRPKIHPDLSAFPRKNTSTGWGIRQLMITPQKTRPSIPDKNDYPYAGALIAVHTRLRTGQFKKMNLQSEWVAGLMGPPSFAEQTQIFLHRLIGDPRPNGWGYQLPTDLLLNYNFTFEKQVAGKNKLLWITGGSGAAGTMLNGLSVYGLLRFQHNMDYFSGLPARSFPVDARKPGLAFSIKPFAGIALYNALLDGGLFNAQSPVHNKHTQYGTDLVRKIFNAGLDIRLQFAAGRFSFTFAQMMNSPDFNKYGWHNVGNIAVSYGW
jgi:lipid A 3-O-deacylase